MLVTLLDDIRELRAKLNLTSHNSSKPPSSDPPSAPPRPQKVPRGRKATGQVGHQGKTRERREPDEIVDCRPTDSPHCQCILPDTLPDARAVLVTQVWELPLLRPIITDYHQHTVCCPTCAAPVTAATPVREMLLVSGVVDARIKRVAAGGVVADLG